MTYCVERYIPYEGSHTESFATLEEAVEYLLQQKHGSPVSYDLNDVSVYKIAESFCPFTLLKEAGYDPD